MNRFLWYWFPAIAWMTTIFVLSSKQNVSVSEVYTVDFLILKSLHIVVYSILYFLLFRALYSQKTKKASIDDVLMKTALVAIVYAASDELHQMFVPTRTGRIRDVVIDSIAIFLMYIYIKQNFRWLKRLII